MRTPSSGRRRTGTAAPRVAARALTAAVVVLLGLTAAPGTAGAAPYDVYSCFGPSGEPVAGSGWTPATTGSGATAAVDCGPGLRAGFAAGQSSGTASASLTFAAPAGTTITAATLDRRLAAANAFLSGGFYARLSSEATGTPIGRDCVAPGGLFAGSCVVDGGDSAVTLTGVAHRALVLTAACSAGSCGGASPATEAVLRRSKVTVEDPSAPTVAGVTGDLGDGARRDRSVVVHAKDVGGGIRSVTASIDGAPGARADSGGTCAAPYVLPQPCPTTREATFAVDTTVLAPGAHVVAGTATDAAGTVTTWGPVPFFVTAPADGPGSVLVPDGAGEPSPPTGTPAAQTPDARLTLAGASTKAGRRQARGLLRTQAGQPIAGATVRLTRTQVGATNARSVALPAVRTGKDGRFVGAVLPEGAWTVAASAEVGSGSVTGTIRLRTSLGLTATPSPTRLRTGGRIVLSGRLTGAGALRENARVQIQTIVRRKWRTVAAVRTTSTGRFTWRHRFTKVSRPTLFSFRAVVPAAETWPWAAVRRTAKSVRVDPR